MMQRLLLSALFGCLATVPLSAQVIVGPAPADSATTTVSVRRGGGLEILGETIICPGTITALKVPGKYARYEWSTGAQTPAITVFKPGTYTVTVTTEGGCMLTGSVTVRYSDDPCL